MSMLHNLILGGLLVLTLSFKIPSGITQPIQEKDKIVRTYIVAFLARQGFEPDHAIEVPQNLVIGSGRSGDCQLLIALVAPQGWHRYIFSSLALDRGQFFFLFRGRKYQVQPVWLTRLSTYWNIAIRNQIEPVFEIVGSSTCDLDAMPWQELVENVATMRQYTYQ
jgi:hypothetical protein